MPLSEYDEQQIIIQKLKDTIEQQKKEIKILKGEDLDKRILKEKFQKGGKNFLGIFPNKTTNDESIMKNGETNNEETNIINNSDNIVNINKQKIFNNLSKRAVSMRTPVYNELIENQKSEFSVNKLLDFYEEVFVQISVVVKEKSASTDENTKSKNEFNAHKYEEIEGVMKKVLKNKQIYARFLKKFNSMNLDKSSDNNSFFKRSSHGNEDSNDDNSDNEEKQNDDVDNKLLAVGTILNISPINPNNVTEELEEMNESVSEEKLNKMKKERKNIIAEMVNSERDFIRDLDIFDKNYVKGNFFVLFIFYLFNFINFN